MDIQESVVITSTTFLPGILRLWTKLCGEITIKRNFFGISVAQYYNYCYKRYLEKYSITYLSMNNISIRACSSEIPAWTPTRRISATAGLSLRACFKQLAAASAFFKVLKTKKQMQTIQNRNQLYYPFVIILLVCKMSETLLH